MAHRTDTKELRQFGILVGSIFLVIGIWPLVFRGENPRIWSTVLGTAMAGLGIMFPKSLRHVHRFWMALGHVLGWINTRIILGVIFFGLITPMGLVMRWFGKDALHLRFVQEASTYRVNRSPRSRLHMRNQF